MDAPQIQIYELYDLWYAPWWKHPYALLFFTIILIIIGWLLFRWFKIRKLRTIKQDPWQEAINRLKALDLSLFQEAETHKIFYTELTIILKDYLSQRYTLSLDGKTDQEVLRSLGSTAFPKDLSNHLEPIMNGAVIIKFSNQDAALERMRYDLMHSIDIVRNTIPLQTK